MFSQTQDEIQFTNLTLFQGKGVWTHPIPGWCAILHTPINFWTTGNKELKLYMVIDIHKLFWKTEKKNWLKVLILQLWRKNYAKITRF